MSGIPAHDESLLPPRYAPGVRLPPYRYVPGHGPHPTADPDGHSYGKPEPTVEPRPPEDWAQNQSYLYGVDLFNRRYYWEAHEAWELVWHTCDKARTQGRFVQGLIQISAALLKWHMGSGRGTRKLYRSALEKLDSARRESPDSYMGLPIGTWLVEIEECFAELLASLEGGTKPRVELPVIRLLDPMRKGSSS